MDNDRSLAIHQLIQSGDTIALAKLYDEYGGNIINVLRIDFPDLADQDESYLFEAVNDALMGYYNNPNTFDPTQKSLKNFLILAAKRDLLNIIERNKKHNKKINLPTDVEVEENIWNRIKKSSQSPDAEIIQSESINLVDEELGKYFTNVTDIELAKMVIRGERETDAFAIVLQIEALEKVKKQEVVKRNKDRIKKILERDRIELKLKKLLQ
ncbi:MAG TPA: hypothetical protein VHA52_13315 [Candidatus Babeliaceae bacterium]|nr:hypothetical protein [Candidatus Babeliaceae bacterium]